jgi:hypothetical protein
VDNLTDAEKKRLNLIMQIQEMYESKVSIREITRRFKVDRRTIRKYIKGDPNILCRSNKRSSLNQYKDFIITCLSEGKTQTETAHCVMELGVTTTCFGNIRQYVASIKKEYQIDVNKYVSCTGEKNKPQKKKVDYITRKGIFQYLWMNGELTSKHHEILWEKYDVLKELEMCIREFREISDISAIENTVASDLSNGFVKGTNSKIKMIKRTMYGRCSKKLLEAKLMYNPE